MDLSAFDLVMICAGAYLLCVVTGSYRVGVLIGTMLAGSFLIHGF